MKIRNYRYSSIKSYKNHLSLFLNFFDNQIIQNLPEEDIGKYILFCAEVKKYSLSSLKHQVFSINFFFETDYNKKRKLNSDFAKKFRKEFKMPNVLSPEDVLKILNSITNLKHKAIITTIYSAGLRLSELTNSKIQNIDYKRNKYYQSDSIQRI